MRIGESIRTIKPEIGCSVVYNDDGATITNGTPCACAETTAITLPLATSSAPPATAAALAEPLAILTTFTSSPSFAKSPDDCA